MSCIDHMDHMAHEVLRGRSISGMHRSEFEKPWIFAQGGEPTTVEEDAETNQERRVERKNAKEKKTEPVEAKTQQLEAPPVCPTCRAGEMNAFSCLFCPNCQAARATMGREDAMNDKETIMDWLLRTKAEDWLRTKAEFEAMQADQQQPTAPPPTPPPQAAPPPNQAGTCSHRLTRKWGNAYGRGEKCCECKKELIYKVPKPKATPNSRPPVVVMNTGTSSSDHDAMDGQTLYEVIKMDMMDKLEPRVRNVMQGCGETAYRLEEMVKQLGPGITNPKPQTADEMQMITCKLITELTPLVKVMKEHERNLAMMMLFE
jgi:hypothetical protein